jgi:hypothetical protein
MSRPKLGEGIGQLIVTSEDVMKFKVIEFLLELSYLLAVCHHVGVTAIRLPHDLVDKELRVTTDVKPLDLELDGDAQVVDEGFIFCHIVCHVKM